MAAKPAAEQRPSVSSTGAPNPTTNLIGTAIYHSANWVSEQSQKIADAAHRNGQNPALGVYDKVVAGSVEFMSSTAGGTAKGVAALPGLLENSPAFAIDAAKHAAGYATGKSNVTSDLVHAGKTVVGTGKAVLVDPVVELADAVKNRDAAQITNKGLAVAASALGLLGSAKIVAGKLTPRDLLPSVDKAELPKLPDIGDASKNGIPAIKGFEKNSTWGQYFTGSTHQLAIAIKKLPHMTGEDLRKLGAQLRDGHAKGTKPRLQNYAELRTDAGIYTTRIVRGGPYEVVAKKMLRGEIKVTHESDAIVRVTSAPLNGHNVKLTKVFMSHDGSSGVIYHLIEGNSKTMQQIIKQDNKLYKKLVTQPMKRDEFLKTLGTKLYWEFNAMPLERGSAAVGDMTGRAIALSRGIDLGRTKPGIALDLEAMTRSKEDFVERFASGAFFEKPSAPR